MRFLDLARRDDAARIVFGTHVEQRACRTAALKGFEGFGGVAQRSDHLHIALRIYGARERIAQHGLVLDNHEPDHDNSFS